MRLFSAATSFSFSGEAICFQRQHLRHNACDVAHAQMPACSLCSTVVYILKQISTKQLRFAAMAHRDGRVYWAPPTCCVPFLVLSFRWAHRGQLSRAPSSRGIVLRPSSLPCASPSTSGTATCWQCPEIIRYNSYFRHNFMSLREWPCSQANSRILTWHRGHSSVT